jgi:hypothetical protein
MKPRKEHCPLMGPARSESNTYIHSTRYLDVQNLSIYPIVSTTLPKFFPLARS